MVLHGSTPRAVLLPAPTGSQSSHRHLFRVIYQQQGRLLSTRSHPKVASAAGWKISGCCQGNEEPRHKVLRNTP